MKVNSVESCPYEDYKDQIITLFIELEEGETIHLKDSIPIELMDGSFVEKEVYLINPKYAGDYSVISKKAKLMVWDRKYGKDSNPTEMIEGPCVAEIVVKDLPFHDIKTDDEIAGRKLMKEMWDNRRRDKTKYAILAYDNKGYYKAIGRYCDKDGKNAIYRIYNDRRYYGQAFYDLNEASECIIQFAKEGKSKRIIYDRIKNVPYTGKKWTFEVIKWKLRGGPLPISKTDYDLYNMVNNMIRRGGKPDKYDQYYEDGYNCGYSDGYEAGISNDNNDY